MGTFFSVYPPNEVSQLSSQDREDLKSAILYALQHDNDIKGLVGDTNLKKIRDILKDKTNDAFNRLKG